MTGHFRITVWDPRLIISQIVSIQSYFYFTLGALLTISSLLVGVEVTLFHIFSYKAISFSDRNGIQVVICYLLNSLTGSFGLWKIVKRTKQCLDFSVTCYLIHLLICSTYNGQFPSSLSWWTVNIAGATIMCVCGEFMCLRTELNDIPLLGGNVDL